MKGSDFFTWFQWFSYLTFKMHHRICYLWWFWCHNDLSGICKHFLMILTFFIFSFPHKFIKTFSKMLKFCLKFTLFQNLSTSLYLAAATECIWSVPLYTRYLRHIFLLTSITDFEFHTDMSRSGLTFLIDLTAKKWFFPLQIEIFFKKFSLISPTCGVLRSCYSVVW